MKLLEALTFQFLRTVESMCRFEFSKADLDRRATSMSSSPRHSTVGRSSSAPLDHRQSNVCGRQLPGPTFPPAKQNNEYIQGLHLIFKFN